MYNEAILTLTKQCMNLLKLELSFPSQSNFINIKSSYNAYNEIEL